MCCRAHADTLRERVAYVPHLQNLESEDSSEEAYDHSSLCNDLDSLNSEIDGLFGYGGAVNG